MLKYEKWERQREKEIKKIKDIKSERQVCFKRPGILNKPEMILTNKQKMIIKKNLKNKFAFFLLFHFLRMGFVFNFTSTFICVYLTFVCRFSFVRSFVLFLFFFFSLQYNVFFCLFFINCSLHTLRIVHGKCDIITCRWLHIQSISEPLSAFAWRWIVRCAFHLLLFFRKCVRMYKIESRDWASKKKKMLMEKYTITQASNWKYYGTNGGGGGGK